MRNALDDIIHDLHNHGITAFREIIAPSTKTIAIVAIFAPDRCICDIEIGNYGRYLVKFRKRSGNSTSQVTREEFVQNLDLWNCNSEHGSIFKGVYQMMTRLRIKPIIHRNEVNHVIDHFRIRDNACLDIEIDDGHIFIGPDIKNWDNYILELANPKCFDLLEEFLYRYKKAGITGDAIMNKIQGLLI